MRTSMTDGVVGRLAPSPTRAQHVGNARTYLLAWLSARSQGGRVVLRIEDVDSPRVKPGAATAACDDLRWLGLDWDGEPIVQTQRLHFYESALKTLQSLELVYPCTCTRTDVERAASAPHAEHEGPVYPGTCAGRSVADAAALGDLPYCLAFSRPRNIRRRGWTAFGDRWPSTYEPWEAISSSGRPASRRRLNACLSVGGRGGRRRAGRDRGAPRRRSHPFDAAAIATLSGAEAASAPFHARPASRGTGRPAFGQAARRHTVVSVARAGVTAESLLGLLAWSCGWIPEIRSAAARELLPLFRLDAVPKTPFVMTPLLFALYQLWLFIVIAQSLPTLHHRRTVS